MHVVLTCLCAYPGWPVLPSAPLSSLLHPLPADLTHPQPPESADHVGFPAGCQLREGGLGMAFMLSSQHFGPVKECKGRNVLQLSLPRWTFNRHH